MKARYFSKWNLLYLLRDYYVANRPTFLQCLFIYYFDFLSIHSIEKALLCISPLDI